MWSSIVFYEPAMRYEPPYDGHQFGSQSLLDGFICMSVGIGTEARGQCGEEIRGVAYGEK